MNPTSVQSIEKLVVAITLCEKRLKDVDDQLDDPHLNLTLTDREWDVIKDDGRLPDPVSSDLRKESWFARV